MVTYGQFQSPTTATESRSRLQKYDVICQSLSVSVSSLIVLMRFYTKLFIIRSPGWEDYTCLAAWLGLIGYAVISLEADAHGSGTHQEYVAKDDLRRYKQLANISQIVYGPLIFLAKLSILLLYLKIFAPIRRSKTYIAIHALAYLNLLYYTAYTIIVIAACIPRTKIWDPTTPGHCLDINAVILSNTIINSISDVSLLLLPIASIWRLQLNTWKKLGISGLFVTGLFACFASIMRLVIGVQKRNTKDMTYDWFPEFLWTSAEISSAIIAGSLPAVPAFFRYFSRKLSKAIKRNSRHNQSNTSGSEAGMKPSSLAGGPVVHGNLMTGPADPIPANSGSYQYSQRTTGLSDISNEGRVPGLVSEDSGVPEPSTAYSIILRDMETDLRQ
ncbi:uncharacterized protein ATNIH1004_010593 [Aspergillus tanneri]|uniref:Rhodopsin domain-containing protein n=1 Tax=Aspergillus tanneri TaxID=1220188 RepID=A0A5M9MAA0_9EURO|nr:uncharacterized protein ATNIH1004_010593 [Aspergillus tanneri]KAA8643818.1 hypothetical protein ATNIH1004_010593 [Aspergillus tanneri]